jgi:hypothetical protein
VLILANLFSLAKQTVVKSGGILLPSQECIMTLLYRADRLRRLLPVLILLALVMVGVQRSSALTYWLQTTVSVPPDPIHLVGSTSLISYFDLTAIQPDRDLDITAFGVHLSKFDVDDEFFMAQVYYRQGTFSGFETDPAAWTLHTNTIIQGEDQGTLSSLPLSGSLRIPGGETYGIAIWLMPVAPLTLVSKIFQPQNLTFTDSYLQLDAGSLRADFNDVGDGLGFAAYTWEIRAYYDLVDPAAPPPAVVSSRVVPNLGMVSISREQTQPLYMSPGGQVIRDGDGNEIRLPQDVNQDGFDTYVVTEVRQVGSVIWLGLFVGANQWGWVPLSGVTPDGPIRGMPALAPRDDELCGYLLEQAADPVVQMLLDRYNCR